MNKKKLEEYLIIYPNIDNQIDNLENELDNLLKKIEKYKNSNIDASSILKTLQAAYVSCNEELGETIKAKAAIQKAFHKATPTQLNIIEYKFWRRRRTTWADVAEEFNYHPKSVERIYGNFMKLAT